MQVSRRWWFGAAMVAALGLGCAGSDATLVVIGNVRPDAACSYSTLPAAPTYDVGTVDIAFERQYVAHVLVHNTGEDEVELNGGWRNVWREPSHSPVISGKGEPARLGLIPHARTIEGGGRAIVEVDVLGAAQISFRRDFEDDIQQGEAPRPIETTTVITFEGDAGGERITSEAWTYGVTVTLGQLVDAPAGSDNPNLPGQDCCLAVASTSCEPGQNDQRGSCSECAGCWPEVCNFSQNPACGGAPVPGCGQ